MEIPAREAETWVIRESPVSLADLAVGESLFALSNGHVGVRGTLDEVEPHGVRGTFLSGVHETYPLAYPEKGFGDPTDGRAMIRVADGTPLRLTVDGVPLDVRAVDPEVHTRELDLRAGVLDRRVVWRTPAGATLELRSRRLVSLSQRELTAVRYEVRAMDGRARLVVDSELGLPADPPEVDNGDPRVREALEQPFELLALNADASGGALAARTRRTRMTVAAAAAHRVSGAAAVRSEADPDGRLVTTVTADLEAGESLTIDKVVGHAWSCEAEEDELLTTVREVVAAGLERGWAELADAQRAVLEAFWATADVEVNGDPELQQALRFNLYTLFTSTACLTDTPLGAKGLTGLGYDGHTFWDIEGFVVPALSLLCPDAAARLLTWRASTLDAARERAAVLDLAGACFAWRTVDGHEASGYWPASTAALHLNADIARAFWLHANATGKGPDALGGLEILVETARLWMSAGHTDADGAWHLVAVTGPDEYTAVVDDNVFTNLMARHNLLRAADACARLPGDAARLGVTAAETDDWRATAAAVHVPWDAHRRVHQANANFTAYREWDFDGRRDDYPVQEHHHYTALHRHQICKQADLVQALWWCREDFTAEEVARDLAYYEARTVRDSSLSASVQAVVCAQAQHPDLAYRYLRESALADLRNWHDDTDEGLHLASVGGTWLALASGLGGLREDADELELSPLLPSQLTRTCYRVTWRRRLLQVETTGDGTTITLLRGEQPVDVLVDGARMTLAPGRPVRAPLRAPAPLLPEPTQPVGRAPCA